MKTSAGRQPADRSRQRHCRWPATCGRRRIPGLTALQTLFVREHNYQVDQLRLPTPGLGPVNICIRKRAPSSARRSRISPTMSSCRSCSGQNFLTPYHGFDPTVDPRITEEFAGAAYRFGHSIVSDDTERVDNLGGLSGGEIELQACVLHAS